MSIPSPLAATSASRTRLRVRSHLFRLGTLTLTAGLTATLAAAEPTIRIDEQQVVAEREKEVPPFLRDVQGAEIYAGKKTAAIDPAEPPKIVNDNYRQVLGRTPGLFLSEETTPLVSLGYRGLDPHRTQFTMVLKDGIPISADPFGYPESYYMPPIDSAEQINFVRGGASLLYGPQPGGALNFITRKPNPTTPFSLYTNQTFGSDSFYSTYNEISGTADRLGYHVYYYQKQGLGFRQSNSDFGLYSGSAKATYRVNDTNRVLLAFDGYNEEHGEPGGLTQSLFQSDRTVTTRKFDRFFLERYIGWGIWESDLRDGTQLRVSTWGGRYTRESRRQRGGGFGTAPSGDAASTNSIEDQRFNTFGIDGRVRQDWSAWDNHHTLTAGVLYFFDDSPRTDKRGQTPDATDGPTRNKSTRKTNYGAVFAENRFTFGKLSIVPAIRLENYSLSIREKINADKQAQGVALADESDYQFQPLFGIGAGYAVADGIDAYANISSSYRPAIYTQAVTPAANQVVAGNLDPSTSWQYEVGFRGHPTPWAFWDTSLFWLQFDDQIGNVQLPSGVSQIRNVGKARHFGWELAGELASLALYDSLNDDSLASRLGDLSLYGSVMILDAKFTAGPFDGKTPAYASDYIVRAGLQYAYPELVKASLLSTVVGNSYANDNNTSNFYVPPYNVWDLTMEGYVYKQILAVYLGVNNIFNENYFARVRSDGIDPAYRRNYYGGIRAYF